MLELQLLTPTEIQREALRKQPDRTTTSTYVEPTKRTKSGNNGDHTTYQREIEVKAGKQ